MAVRGGFSLPEVLVATAVACVSMLSASSGFSVGLGLLEATRQELRATQILEEKMETIRLYNWDQMQSPGSLPATFTAAMDPLTNSGVTLNGTVTLGPVPGLATGYSSNLCQVTATVSWQAAGLPHQRSMSTLVSRYGIQNYVY
jgi:prepilin-type N-terminal cleavage/methylation domain-containing protein